MQNLFDELVDNVTINGKRYDLHLWFDTVLRFFQLVKDDQFTDAQKTLIAFNMFVDDNGDDIEPEARVATVHTIIDQFIIGKDEGKKQSDSATPKKAYDLDQDAQYIYASFKQEYGIDLIDEQGSLRWEKFTALIAGLRDSTKFQEIIGIRMAKIPSGKGTEQEAKRLRELKKIYALEESHESREEDMNNMFNQYLTGGKIK